MEMRVETRVSREPRLYLGKYRDVAYLMGGANTEYQRRVSLLPIYPKRRPGYRASATLRDWPIYTAPESAKTDPRYTQSATSLIYCDARAHSRHRNLNEWGPANPGFAMPKTRLPHGDRKYTEIHR